MFGIGNIICSERTTVLARFGTHLIFIYPFAEVGWDVPNSFGYHVLVENSATPPIVKTSLSLYAKRTAAARGVMDNVNGENLHRKYLSEISCNDEYCFANDVRGLYYQADHNHNLWSGLAYRQH